MSFQVECGEISKAKSLGKRALKSIPVWSGRKEAADDERMNIWIALINLERNFGAQASEKVTISSSNPVWQIFEDSLRESDPLVMYKKMAELMEEGGEEVAGEVWKRVVKRWGGVELWGKYIGFLIRQREEENIEEGSNIEDVSSAISRGMQSVGPSHHLHLSEKVAIAEMDFGLEFRLSHSIYVIVIIVFSIKLDPWREGGHCLRGW